MKNRENSKQLGQKVAEAVATKAYDRYGDKIPIDLDPQQVADAAYSAAKHIQEKRRAKARGHKLLKAVGIGTIGVLCVAGTLAVIAVREIKR